MRRVRLAHLARRSAIGIVIASIMVVASSVLTGCAEEPWHHSFLVLEDREECVRDLLQANFTPDEWLWEDIDWRMRSTEHIGALVRVRSSTSNRRIPLKYDVQIIEGQCIPYKGSFEIDRATQAFDSFPREILRREAAGSKEFSIHITEELIQVYFDIPSDYQHIDYLEGRDARMLLDRARDGANTD